MKRATQRILLASLVIALGASTPARAHPGQSIGLTITIEDEQVTYAALISADLRDALLADQDVYCELKKVPGGFDFAADADRERLADMLTRLVRETCPLTVDGIVVQPIIDELELVLASPLGYPLAATELPPDTRVVFRYPLKGRPQQVRMVWGIYPRDISRARFGLAPPTEVVAELDAYTENRLIVFIEEEPEYIWHAPDKPVVERVNPVVVQYEPRRLHLPLLSLVIVAAGLVAVVVLRLALAPPGRGRVTWLTAAVAVVAAAATYDVLAVSVTVPWGRQVSLPDDAAARAIFTRLHRNVYRAFDYKQESDIYDVLTRSVAGELLDQVYSEVYQSLILRDQGGAIARVKNVDIRDVKITESGILPEEQTAAFKVRSRWRVEGAVYHWGHVHRRTNEYVATYTIAQRGGEWKITGVTDTEQRRIIGADDDPVARVTGSVTP